jgi:type II secretory pathway pseudopilin PulG
MSDETPRKRRRPSCAACCGTGCFGTVVLVAIAFGWFMAHTAQYHPAIPPPPPLPSPNGFDDYVAAGKMLKDNGGMGPVWDYMYRQQSASGPGSPGAMVSGGNPGMMSGSTPSGSTPLVKPGPWKSLLEVQQFFVARNQPALKRMRAAFPKECRVPAARSFNDLFDYLAPTRDMARLLSAEADVRASRGDYAGAFDDGLDAMQMGNDMARGGTIIHGLVAIACTAIGQDRMVKYLEKLSAADCDRLAARMQRLLLARVPGADVLKEERDAAISGFAKIDDAILSGDADAIKQQFSGDGPGLRVAVRLHADAIKQQFSEDDGLGAFTRSLPGRLWWRYYRDGAYEEMEAMLRAEIANAKVPAVQRKTIPEPKNIIASIFSPVYMQALSRFDLNDARCRLILCALAIRSYRLKQGRLPGTLNDLKLDPSLLIDPCTGKQLIYRPQGKDYLLYSVGPDLKDDGGIPLIRDDPQQGPGDIGIAMFRLTNPSGGKSGPVYRPVPHMKLPKLPPGATLMKE